MVYMQYLHELEIKFRTWMGLEPWHSGLWVQSKGVVENSLLYKVDLGVYNTLGFNSF